MMAKGEEIEERFFGLKKRPQNDTEPPARQPLDGKPRRARRVVALRGYGHHSRQARDAYGMRAPKAMGFRWRLFRRLWRFCDGAQ